MTLRGIGLIAFLAAIAVAPAASVAQNKAGTVPRTPDGKPDLQGIWSYATITPVERPAEFAGKEFLTEQEAAAYEKRILQDSVITARVKAALLAERGIPSLSISVETYEGGVLLKGFVNAADIVSRAGRITAGVAGVRTVHNNIGVRQ